MPPSAAETLLWVLVTEQPDLAALESATEARFTFARKWRFDLAWPAWRVAVEVEGVRYDGESRHQKLEGYTEDCVKYNAALLAGWLVLRYTQFQVLEHPDHVIAGIREALQQRGALPRD